jgi:ATP-binding cassette subfamily B protein
MEVTDGEKMLDAPERVSEITLKNVSFKYNNTDKNVLHDINMVIKPYQKIALVGYNGAGKTTLAKLIMRLYDPTDGEVQYAGINVTDFKLKSYRDCFGSVFQDFILFATTIGENVVMDEVNDCDKEKITDSLDRSGFSDKLCDLPKSIDSFVYREFDEDGVYLSRGEEQKIAISRVFYKSCHVVILDEPSSALDPLIEYELNQKMMDVANKKTVIFISHRLSTTRNADKIFMLENGTIIEEGTHEELMSLKGKYAEMFNMQAEKYRKGSYA